MKKMRNALSLRLSPVARLLQSAVVLVLSFGTLSSLQAQTWNGGGSDDNWTTADNWDVVPVANDPLIFAGTLRLTPFNDFAANTQFNGITFASGAGAFTLGGNAINLGGNVTNLSSNTQSIGTTLGLALLQNTSFNASTAAITVNGGISGAGFGLTKLGGNTLTLGTTLSTYDGATKIQQGTVTLAFSGTAGTSNNLISSISALELGGFTGWTGASLNATSKTSTHNAQTFAGTTVKAGQNTLTLARANSGGSMTVNLGAITREANGLLRIAAGTNGTLGSTVHVDGSGSLANGILGGWATYGGDWATISGSDVVAYSAYTVPAGTNPVIASGATTNVRISNTNAKAAPSGVTNTLGTAVITMTDTAAYAIGDVLTGTGIPVGSTIISVDSPTQITISANSTVAVAAFTAYAPVTLGAAVTDINTLQINDVNSRIIDIGGGNTLRLGVLGGIWRSSTTSTNRVLITGGTLTAGGADNTAGEIVLRGDGAGGGLLIDSNITNNGTGVVKILKSGIENVILGGTNTYTGGTHILQGRVTFNTNSSFGSGDIHVYAAASNPGEASLATGVTSTNNFLIASPDIGGTTNALFLNNNTEISGNITQLDQAKIRVSAVSGGISILSGVFDSNGHRITFDNSGAQSTSNVIRLRLKEGSDFGSGGVLIQNTGTNGGGTILELGENAANENPLTWDFATLDFRNARTGGGGGNNSTTGVRLNGLDLNVGVMSTSQVNINSKGYVVISNNNAAADTATLTVNSGQLRGALQNGNAAAVLNLVKEGSGTFKLSTYYTNTFGGESRSTYTGSTTITEGVLEVDNVDQITARVTATSVIDIRTGGTLRLVESSDVTPVVSTDRIGNAVPITLDGGTFDLNGLSEGTASAVGLGLLTVKSNSIIDFGTGDTSIVNFAGIARIGGTLTINNWAGTSLTGFGTERLMFAGVTSDFTSLFTQGQVAFTGHGSGYVAVQDGSFYEIAAIPEPATISLLGLAGVAAWLLRRKSRRG